MQGIERALEAHIRAYDAYVAAYDLFQFLENLRDQNHFFGVGGAAASAINDQAVRRQEVLQNIGLCCPVPDLPGTSFPLPLQIQPIRQLRYEEKLEKTTDNTMN